VFAPIFYDVSLEIIDKCNKENIPYVFFDVSIDDSKSLAFYGQNAYMSGYLAGKLMSYALDDSNEVLILKGKNITSSGHHLDKREQGFRAFFSSIENNKVVNINTAEIDIWSQDLLYGQLMSTLNKYSRLKGIFVINSRVHKFASYFEEKKIRDLLIIGYDLLEENVRYLDKGIVQFLISQNPEEQGYKSVMALFDHLVLNKQVHRINYSPIDIIMKENIDYYKKIKI
jgi:LacI family transcriptional regulator